MPMTYVPRPIEGHKAQGAAAYFAHGNPAEPRNPYPENSVAAASWLVGFREEALGEAKVIASDAGHDDDESWALHALSADLYYANTALARLLEEARTALPTIPQVEHVISLPARDWPLRCYEIATKLADSRLLDPLMARHGAYAAQYGVYDGEVATGSPFSKKTVIRHGWVEFEHGLVVDPTRFVFLNESPVVWCGETSEHNLGANRLKQNAISRARPACAADARLVRWTANDPVVLARAGDLLQDRDRLETERSLTLQQVFWLANLPPEVIGPLTPQIYRAIDALGQSAAIPVDNRRRVEWIEALDRPLQRADGPRAAPRFSP